MGKIEIEIGKISQIWEKFKIEGYLNVHKTISKELSYVPLGNEIGIHENIEIGASLNIFKNRKKLNLKIENFTYDNISKLIEKNLFLLDIGDEDDDNVLYPTKDNSFDDLRKFKLDDIKGDFLLKQWEKAKDFRLEQGISIEGFSYSLIEKESHFMNSFGSLKSQKSSYCNYQYVLLYSSEKFSDFDYNTKYSDIPEDISNDFMSEVQTRLLTKSDPKKPTLKSGKYDITIRNDVVGEFLELFMQSCRGETIRQKQGFFSRDDIGKSVMNENITIRSNPKRIDSPFNNLFDSEGITSEKMSIIEDGILKNIFLDSKNARKFNMNPNGNPTYSNLEIIGNEDKDYLKGSSFLFTSFLGIHMTDMTTGKFAVEGEGFEIIDGKIGNFVKNVGFSGNIKDLFLKLSKIGNDVYTYSNIFTPSLNFKDQTLIF